MKVKVAEASSVVLDWMVAKCEGKLVTLFCGVMVRNGPTMSPTHNDPLVKWNPSTNPAQSWPIIEREKLEVRANDYEWQAFCFGFPTARAHSGQKVWASGPTPLTAAMRCVVAANLGNEVDVPDELV